MKQKDLFPINVWPPLVDAVALALAAFVLVAMVALVAQHAVVGRLREREHQLEQVQEERTRLERRLKSLAQTGVVEVDEGKVIFQGEVLFDPGSDELRPE